MARKELDPETLRRSAAFADLLRKAREREGLSQSDLASASGVSLDVIRSIECGRLKVPGVFSAYRLAVALRADLAKWLKQID